MDRTASLTLSDLEMFARLHIDRELLRRAGIQRVSDQEARHDFGLNVAGDNAGIVFPYVDAAGTRRTCRLRRDRPDMENGKPVRKYLAPYGDRRHLYIVPGDHALGQDPTVPVVIVEAEKSALALRAFTDRIGLRLLPIATGGCWGRRGRVGKVENPNGERVDELGPLPELGTCCDGRRVYVLFDVNSSRNSKVRDARNALVRQLLKQKAEVRVLDLPEREGVNGPDDYIGLFGDKAMTLLLDSPPVKLDNWRQLLICRETRSGPQPERILANVLTAFRCAPEWDGVLGFNQFSQQVVSRAPTPWGKPAGTHWTEDDDSRATEWFQKEGRIFVTSPTVAEAVQTLAHEHPFHPVRDYLGRLIWDGVRRIDTWLVTYLGCGDSDFVHAVGACFLVSAVARIFQPGCQADHVLLLEGPQGIKKSSALRALVGDEFFTDHIADLGSKDSRVELQGKWVIEISELASMRGAEIERVKAFLTARSDHFRPPYGRRAVDVPRQNVFAASTNEWQRLPSDAADESGRDLLSEDKCTAPRAVTGRPEFDPLWTPEQVAERLNVSPDWVRDHSSRKEPRLPVIRLGGGPGRAGLLRYRRSEIEKFIDEMEVRSNRNSRRL